MLHRMTPMVLLFLLACLPSMASETTSTWRVDLTKAVETKEPAELKMLAAHERAEVRAAAAQRLPAVVGSESLDLLAKMSIDEDERVGIAATGSLLDLQDPQVVPVLKKVFEVGQPDVIRELVIRLGERQDDRFMPELAALLGSDDTNVRAGVLTSVRAINSPQGLPILLAATGDAVLKVRLNAVQAIKSLGDARAMPRLILLLNDSDDTFRAEVVTTIISLGGMEQHQDKILTTFKGLSDSGQSQVFVQLKDTPSVHSLPVFKHIFAPNTTTADRVKINAARALKEAAFEPADEWLVKLLNDPSQSVKMTAIKSIGERGSLKSVAALEKFVTDESPDIRAMLAFQYGKLPQANPLSALTKLSEDAVADVRAAAGTACIELGTEASLVPVVKLINDPEEFVRSSVVFALANSELGEPANKLLRAAVDDESLEVRLAAIRVLGERRDSKAVEKLMPLAQSEVERIRRTAKKALQLIQN